MAMANTLAYYETATIMGVISFIVQTTGAKPISFFEVNLRIFILKVRQFLINMNRCLQFEKGLSYSKTNSFLLIR